MVVTNANDLKDEIGKRLGREKGEGKYEKKLPENCSVKIKIEGDRIFSEATANGYPLDPFTMTLPIEIDNLWKNMAVACNRAAKAATTK
jgi:hypothetical protein